MAPEVQTYKNHTRIMPAYHYGVLGVLTLNVAWTLYRAAQRATGDAIVNVLVAAALLALALVARTMALTVQDRVIRLEMRLRLREVLPPELRSRVSELTVRQLVALRFAADAELPQLVRETLEGRLRSGKEIKLRISDWQADYLRA
jgi:hypothetical protein